MRYILLSVLFLTGCFDQVVKFEKLGEPTVREETISCRQMGYCYTCMPGFDGKMNCGFKMSTMCPGNKLALVEHQDVRYYYESGKIVVHDDTTVVKELEMCH